MSSATLTSCRDCGASWTVGRREHEIDCKQAEQAGIKAPNRLVSLAFPVDLPSGETA